MFVFNLFLFRIVSHHRRGAAVLFNLDARTKVPSLRGLHLGS